MMLYPFAHVKVDNPKKTTTIRMCACAYEYEIRHMLDLIASIIH